MIVIFPIWAADQRRAHSGDRFDLVVAGVDIGNDLLGGQTVIVGVVVAVVHDLVSRLVERAHRFRVLIHPFADYEKSCFDTVTGQYVNQLLGVLVTPGGCDFAVHLCYGLTHRRCEYTELCCREVQAMEVRKPQKAINHPKAEHIIQVDRRFSEGRRSSDLVKRLMIAHNRI